MGQVIKKHFKSFCIVAFLILICNLLNVLHPFVIKQIVDLNFNQKNIVNILLLYFAGYVLIHLFLVILRNVTNMKQNKTMAFLLRDIRDSVFRKVLKFKIKTFNKYNSSEIYTRLTADIDNVSSLFLGTMQIVLNNVIYIITMVIFMFFADIRLAMIGSTAIILNAVVSYIFTHQVANCNKMILDKRDKENRQFSEMYHKSKLTFLFGLQKKNENKKIGKKK